jgi:hypothetical protein
MKPRFERKSKSRKRIMTGLLVAEKHGELQRGGKDREKGRRMTRARTSKTSKINKIGGDKPKEARIKQPLGTS